jgi:aminoglycoside phosphotransferase (APT) family kinase protein
MELTADTCLGYLAERGEPLSDGLRVRELGGGVSNRVLLVEGPAGRFVLKQALDKLRVQDDWRADRSRIFREMRSLQDAARFFPSGALPRVLWCDPERYLFAMSAAEPAARNWKTELLAGRVDPAVAATAGTLLGLWIRHTWANPGFEQRYGDQTVFGELRIDPYYRAVARRHPGIAGAVEALLRESGERRVSLVHGDWSPKNFLITSAGLMVIDFEAVHYGDPAFDAAFCINHFCLKSFRRPEMAPQFLDLARIFFAWTCSLLPPAALSFFETATVRHLGCLLLARVDGKSPVEYITAEPLRQAVRETALQLIGEAPRDLEGGLAIVARGVVRR